MPKRKIVDSERLATFPELNPGPVLELNAAGEIQYLNPVARRLFPDIERLGIKHEFLHGIDKLFKKLQKNNGKIIREISLNGYSFQQVLVRIPKAQIYRIYSTNITDRKKSEIELTRVNRALKMVSDINQTLIHSEDETSLLNKTCRIATEVGGYRLAWVGFAERDKNKTVSTIAKAGAGIEYLRRIKITWADEKNGRGPTGTAIRTKRIQVSRDIAKDPRMLPWRKAALKHGFRSSIALPLSDKGRVFGCLTVYATEVEAFSPKEVKILEELAGDLSFGIVEQRLRIEHREIEEKFLTAFRASPDLISITSIDGTILEVNDAYTKLLGYSRSESIGKKTAELSIWADFDDRAKFISTLKKFGEIHDFETKLRRKDGVLIPCVDSARILELRGEKCVMSVVRDITERKKAEMEREQFFKFFNLSTDIMVIADPNGAFKKVNPTCLRVLGYSESDLLSKPFIDFVHPDDKQPTLKEMARQIKIGSSINFENRYVCKNGKVLLLSWRANYDKKDKITYATARDITESRNAMDIISKNEIELKEAQRIGLFGNFDWDARTDKIVWSDEYYLIYGFRPGIKPPGYAEHLKTYTPETAAVLDAAVKNSMKTGQPYEVELEHIRPDGTHKWILARGEVKRDENNKIVGLRGTAQDITEHKKAAEKDRNFAAIVESTEDAIYGKDLHEIITSWNHGAEKMYGYTAKEAIGKHISLIVPKELRGELTKMITLIKKGGHVQHFDTMRVAKDGHRFYASVTFSPIFNDRGKIIAISAIARDISDYKKAELEIFSVNRALRIVSNINEALIRINDEIKLLNEACRIAVETGKYLLAWVGFAENDEAKTIRPVAHFGLKSGYVEKLNLTWADTERGRGPSGLSIRTGKYDVSNDIANDPKMRPWREKALRRGYKSSISLPLISNGKTFGVFSIYSHEINSFSKEEIRILQELADDLAFGIMSLRERAEHNKSEQRIKELSEIRSKFIEIISHQLRTPLTAVNWNLETLLNGDYGKIDDTQLKFLQVTHNASVEITNRIHDLLTAMDVEEGSVRYITEEVNLNGLCAGVFNEMSKKSDLKNISFSYTPPTKVIPPIYGDGEKLRTVISVLVGNAIDYTKNRGKISMKLYQNGETIRFEVSDNGVGIPKSEQHLVFDRFFRASNASVMRTDAFGLGLFLAKHFTEQHGGKIGFESKEGKGSTFWVELPLNKK